MADDNNQNGHNFLAGMVLGGLVGAVAAYFLSSEDKEELRKKIINKGKLLLDDIEEFKDKAVKTGGKISGEVIDRIEEAGEKVQEIPEIAQEAVASVQKVAEAAMENIADTAKEVEKSANKSVTTQKRKIGKFFLKKGRSLVK